ncbi:tRNA-specific adenosine deaminase [Rubripirellula obstinata]|uniref:tRNA-specific adenosine deaminase n=1 Tax=Rubripirellula obstinata TaxID=406547 RepID=A0A5B1CGJ0_9BACT|nr:nucleoside deaminase [Rubripirellula obstinata]KAA1258643.1 tRNA-specific adenosine deaminase [Rubripirellula obstinata]
MNQRVTSGTLNRWMQSAIDECQRGITGGQSPFAAAIYDRDGNQLSLAHNIVRQTSKPSHHAEVMAIDMACSKLKRKTLPDDAWLVSTGEPCPMCAATAANAGIRNIAFGASRHVIVSAGFQTLGLGCEAFFQACNVSAKIVGDIEADQCGRLLMDNAKE